MNLIYTDLNKNDGPRLILTCLGTHRDLEESNITLSPGLKLTFYDYDVDDNGNPDNLVFEGVVEYDDHDKVWIARIIWEDIKNISQLSPEERKRLGLDS